MTSDRRPTPGAEDAAEGEVARRLEHWFADRPPLQVDDRIEAALASVARTPQRRVLRSPVALPGALDRLFAPGRRSAGVPRLLLQAVTAVLVVAVVSGAILLRIQGTTPEPLGTLAPPPIGVGGDDTARLQAALDTCVPGGPRCVVRLQAGTYATRQLLVTGFHGSVVGAGAGLTTIENAADYQVAPDPLASPPSPENPWPYIITFAGASDVTMSDLLFTITGTDPVPGPWNDAGVSATWLEGAVYVRGSGRLDRVQFLGGTGMCAGLDDGRAGTDGSNVDSAVHVDGAGQAGAFTMRRSFVSSIGNAFVLAGFSGTATIGGAGAGNNFTGGGGGVFRDLDGATVQESWDTIHTQSQAGPTIGGFGYWAVYFRQDRPTSRVSTVALSHLNVTSPSVTYGGIGIFDRGPTGAGLSVAVTGSRIEFDEQTSSNPSVYAEGTSGLTVTGNIFVGSQGSGAIIVRDSAGATIGGNDFAGVSPTGTPLTTYIVGARAGATVSLTLPSAVLIDLESDVSRASVTCLHPTDTVLDRGSGDSVTGCTLAATPK